METKQALEVAMIALAFIIVGVLVSAPYVETKMVTNSTVIEGNVIVSDAVNITADLEQPEYGEGFYWGMTHNGDVAFQSANDETDWSYSDIHYYDSDTGNISQLTYINSSAWIFDLHNEFLTYEYDNDIYVKNIETNVTSQITHTVGIYESMPCIWGDNIIYTRNYQIYWYDWNTAIETAISPASLLYTQLTTSAIYENIVVYHAYDGDYNVYAAYLNDPDTFENPIYLGEGQYPSIWEKHVLWNPDDYTIELLNLFTREGDTYTFTDPNLFVSWATISEDFVAISLFNMSDGNNTVGLVRIYGDSFGTEFHNIVTAYGMYFDDFSYPTITTDLWDESEQRYNVVIYNILEVEEEEEQITPEEGGVIEEYNYSWIYFSVIAIMTLVAIVAYYYSEYVLDY